MTSTGELYYYTNYYYSENEIKTFKDMPVLKKFPFMYLVCMLSCLTLWDLMDCSLPGSPVHGIFQAKILSGLSFPSPLVRKLLEKSFMTVKKKRRDLERGEVKEITFPGM